MRHCRQSADRVLHRTAKAQGAQPAGDGAGRGAGEGSDEGGSDDAGPRGCAGCCMSGCICGGTVGIENEGACDLGPDNTNTVNMAPETKPTASASATRAQSARLLTQVQNRRAMIAPSSRDSLDANTAAPLGGETVYSY